MKIAIVGTRASSLYTFRLDLIKKLLRNGHEVFVFYSSANQQDIKKLLDIGVTPIAYPLSRSGLNPFADLRSLFVLYVKIMKIKPYLVFSYFSKPVIWASLAAWIARVPKRVGMLEGLGYTFTDQPEGINIKIRIARWVQIFLYSLSLPILDRLILLNRDDYEDLIIKNKIKQHNVEILGGIGLNLEDFPYVCPNNEENIRFLFIGRLIKEKGIYDFISALKIVKRDYPSAIFTILGRLDKDAPGALSIDELQELIDDGLVEYPGHVNNISDWIAASHIFVLPSYYREGVPRSTQEAMAIGRPVITTDVPGCRETVIDGVSGFLVPKWKPKILAEKMIYFLNNKNKITSMGTEGHRIAVEKFDADLVNDRLIKILYL